MHAIITENDADFDLFKVEFREYNESGKFQRAWVSDCKNLISRLALISSKLLRLRFTLVVCNIKGIDACMSITLVVIGVVQY
jgi:hypothetical protein